MLRDVEAIVVIGNLMAVALGYMWRRRRARRRPSADLEHVRQLEAEHEEMDRILRRIGADEPSDRSR